MYALRRLTPSNDNRQLLLMLNIAKEKLLTSGEIKSSGILPLAARPKIPCLLISGIHTQLRADSDISAGIVTNEPWQTAQFFRSGLLARQARQQQRFSR